MRDLAQYEIEAIDDQYQEFRIPKRRGGTRKIEAPLERLRDIQREILDDMYQDHAVYVSPFAHGFVPNRSTITAALPHVGKDVIVTVDIKDFFNSCREEKMLEEFKVANNYDKRHTEEEVAYMVGLIKSGLTTRRGYLPQGAPTSPHLSNVFLRSVDWRLARVAYKLYAADYTRYADDLIFSNMKSSSEKPLTGMIPVVRDALKNIGLSVNEDKIKIMRKHTRQRVLGLVVNEKVNLVRSMRKNLRAAEFQVRSGQRQMDMKLKGELAYRDMTMRYLEMDAARFSSREIIQHHGVVMTLDACVGVAG